MTLRKRKEPPRRKAPAKPTKPKMTWMTTYRWLLRYSTFATLDELQDFLEGLGLHEGDVPTSEAFRRGLAKSHCGKFFWHHGKCTRLLKDHDKLVEPKGEE
jgi:hypothetical protein